MKGNQETERLTQIVVPQLQKEQQVAVPATTKSNQQSCTNGVCKITWKPAVPPRN